MFHRVFLSDYGLGEAFEQTLMVSS